MDGSFTTILRDIMVILAATALAAASVIGVLVVWQLYRLGRQLYVDVQPILDSVYGTSETVRGTAQFMNTRMHERVGAALAIAQTSRTLTQLVREFYRGAPSVAAPAVAPSPSPTSSREATPAPGAAESVSGAPSQSAPVDNAISEGAGADGRP